MKGCRKYCIALFFVWVGVSSLPKESHAMFYPSVYAGGKIPEFHTAVGLDMGWMWEQGWLAYLATLPIETDFKTRVAFGPKAGFELNRYFRVYISGMAEYDYTYNWSGFVRFGLAGGFRTTGDYIPNSEPGRIENPTLRAGAYLSFYVDVWFLKSSEKHIEPVRFLLLLTIDLPGL